MKVDSRFDWVDFYTELAQKLRPYRNDRQTLNEMIEQIFSTTGLRRPRLDKEYDQIIDIDPFTFYGLFNRRSLSESNRKNLLGAIKDAFGVVASIPSSFSGVPCVNPLNGLWRRYVDGGGDEDSDNLWGLFESALDFKSLPSPEGTAAFPRFLTSLSTLKTMGTARPLWDCFGLLPTSSLVLTQQMRITSSTRESFRLSFLISSL